ncbi:MAG: GGDEF domain-containing protein [Planctomycetes bacterium]|nr:GGDEF domain-containing protein [Planctomycetota bacterium]
MNDHQADDSHLFSLAQIQHLMRVEFNRAQRYGYPISCMMVSVDRLGYLRDLYGYDVKELILDKVIGLLKTETRSSDFLGRLPDDRLLTVVPHTGAEGTEVLANRILSGARALEFRAGDRNLGVTLSIGFSYSGGEDTMFFDALLEAADEALDDAQSQGGDRLLQQAPGGRH